MGQTKEPEEEMNSGSPSVNPEWSVSLPKFCLMMTQETMEGPKWFVDHPNPLISTHPTS
jgi:hypothetical protein